MAKAAQTGFSVFRTTSVLWQMVKLGAGQGGDKGVTLPSQHPPSPSPPECSEDFWTSPPMPVHGDIGTFCAKAEPSRELREGHCAFQGVSLTSHLRCCGRRP